MIMSYLGLQPRYTLLLGTCNAVITGAACGSVRVIFIAGAAQAFPVQDVIKTARDFIRYVNVFRVSFLSFLSPPPAADIFVVDTALCKLTNGTTHRRKLLPLDDVLLAKISS